MLTIKPKINDNNKEKYEVVFEAVENTVLTGTLNTEITPEVIVITGTDYDSSDVFILDGLCRSAFAFALNRGVPKAHFSFFDNSLEKLGYSAEMDIKSFFDKNCKNSL